MRPLRKYTTPDFIGLKIFFRDSTLVHDRFHRTILNWPLSQFFIPLLFVESFFKMKKSAKIKADPFTLFKRTD